MKKKKAKQSERKAAIKLTDEEKESVRYGIYVIDWRKKNRVSPVNFYNLKNHNIQDSDTYKDVLVVISAYPELKIFFKEIFDTLFTLYDYEWAEPFASDLSAYQNKEQGLLLELKNFLDKQPEVIKLSAKVKEKSYSVEITPDMTKYIRECILKNDSFQKFLSKNIKQKDLGKKNRLASTDLLKNNVFTLFAIVRGIEAYKGTTDISNEQCKIIQKLISCIDIYRSYQYIRKLLAEKI